MQDGLSSKAGSCTGVWLIIFAVPFFAVAVLAVGYAGYIPFSVGLHTLVTLVAIFIIFLFFIRHNAAYSACKISRNFLKMEEDLQDGLKKNALTIMGKTKSTLSVRDFIEEYFKDVRDDNYARVAATVFPMLGILGTFVAIAISMPDFTVSSSEKLDEQISLLLSGIGTAFYASIFGIFLSLWWIFFERRGLAMIEKDIIALEKLYGDRIWKRSELTKHEHMQTELRDQKIIDTLRETFNMDFIKDLNEQYMRNYKQIVEDTGNSYMLMAEKMKEASEDLRSTLSMLHDRRSAHSAEETIEKNLVEFVHSAQRLEEGLKRFESGIEYTFSAIDSELAAAVEKLGEMTEIIARESQKVQDNHPAPKSGREGA